jgi:DNA processing protein
MTSQQDIPYLMALAHGSKLRIGRINELLAEVLREKQLSLEDFFKGDEELWSTQFLFDEKTLTGLRAAKAEAPNSSFIAEDLYAQGFEVLPIWADAYPPVLRANLTEQYAPSVLYVKGNTQIFQEDSIAVVGSRAASERSLQFTEQLVKDATARYQVIVSGFAKGVDQHALDSALKYKGRSIVVLPQGIMTFGTGIRKYYEQIVEGDVVVVSTFFPKAPWSVQLAMGRNPYIYGLAKHIYVAESGAEGGTRAGVLDGLKKGRLIYVRKPEPSEANANQDLIDAGAVAVDFDANVIETQPPKVAEPVVKYLVPLPDVKRTRPEKLKTSAPEKQTKSASAKKKPPSDLQAELDFGE